MAAKKSARGVNLATLLAGLDATIVRDGDVDTFGALTATLEATLHYYMDPRFADQLKALTGQRSVIATIDLADQVPSEFGLAVATYPREVFLLAYLNHGRALLAPAPFATEIHPTARVHPRAWVADQNVRIGPNVVIDANAVIMERVEIEEGVYIGPGCVIGSSGFEVAMVGGRQIIVPHCGGVSIRSGVSILANSCVACGLYGDNTEVGHDTMIDNLVHVAHNVQIGDRCQLMASAMLAGSCVLEDEVRIGPGATISNAIRIGSGARVTLGSVVTRDVPANGHVTGNFAISHQRFIELLRVHR